MAEKHKSKYKAPKDLEKSQKPKARKDLKDYTMDDKDEKLNPKSTGEKAMGLRKTDKPMQDDGKMYPKYNADDRLYKDIEEGEYDPKDAAKKMKKRIETEKKDVEDVLKDKIENLTSEQKERLVREYIRRKIAKVLQESSLNEQPAEETPETEAPAEETPDATAAPTPDASAAPTPDATAAPTPDAAAAPAPTLDATAAPTETPTPDATAAPPATPAPTEEPAPEPISVSAKDLEQLNQGGTVTKVKKLNTILDKIMQDSDVSDQRSFYQLLAKLSIKKMRSIQHK